MVCCFGISHDHSTKLCFSESVSLRTRVCSSFRGLVEKLLFAGYIFLVIHSAEPLSGESVSEL